MFERKSEKGEDGEPIGSGIKIKSKDLKEVNVYNPELHAIVKKNINFAKKYLNFYNPIVEIVLNLEKQLSENQEEIIGEFKSLDKTLEKIYIRKIIKIIDSANSATEVSNKINKIKNKLSSYDEELNTYRDETQILTPDEAKKLENNIVMTLSDMEKGNAIISDELEKLAEDLTKIVKKLKTQIKNLKKTQKNITSINQNIMRNLNEK
jgi:uncharacterized coiled-coil DUF342 family protein